MFCRIYFIKTLQLPLSNVDKKVGNQKHFMVTRQCVKQQVVLEVNVSPIHAHSGQNQPDNFDEILQTKA